MDLQAYLRQAPRGVFAAKWREKEGLCQLVREAFARAGSLEPLSFMPGNVEAGLTEAVEALSWVCRGCAMHGQGVGKEALAEILGAMTLLSPPLLREIAVAAEGHDPGAPCPSTGSSRGRGASALSLAGDEGGMRLLSSVWKVGVAKENNEDKRAPFVSLTLSTKRAYEKPVTDEVRLGPQEFFQLKDELSCAARAMGISVAGVGPVLPYGESLSRTSPPT